MVDIVWESKHLLFYGLQDRNLQPLASAAKGTPRTPNHSAPVAAGLNALGGSALGAALGELSPRGPPTGACDNSENSDMRVDCGPNGIGLIGYLRAEVPKIL